LPEYNGELFFSKYLIEQREQKKQDPPHKVNDPCQCLFCAWNKLPLPYMLETIEDVNDSTMDGVNDMIDFGTYGDLDGDCIDDPWLTAELATCAFKAEELAPHTTLALFLEATPTPNTKTETLCHCYLVSQ
jgi:hypothetical protein